MVAPRKVAPSKRVRHGAIADLRSRLANLRIPSEKRAFDLLEEPGRIGYLKVPQRD
jgi:hypothetical protein